MVTTELQDWDYQQDGVRLIAPGLLRSLEGPARALLSIYQGILHNSGEYSDLIPAGSHGKHQLGVAGLIGKHGAIASIVELSWEYDLYVDGPADLHDATAYLPVSPLGHYEASYVAEFRVCRPNVFDVAQKYREFKIGRDEFTTWQEKIETTPGLERLFGAPHLFLGYFEGQHDVLAHLRQVANAGFERAFVYPTVFRTYQPDNAINNIPFLNLQSLHEEIKQLGFHIASWSWPEEVVIEAKSDPALWGLLAANTEGKSLPAWVVGDKTWYTVAAQTQVQFMQWAQAHQWPELTGQHFDVTGNKITPHYYGADAFPIRADTTIRSIMLSNAARLGPVSTEGFCDGFIESIHCGSVLALPAWGEDCWWTVPLSSIIFHDSAMHVWWECDSYNNPFHSQQGNRDHHAVKAGGGKALDQSLLDALQGTPPNVFLCGKMYRPSDNVSFGNGATYYDISFDDQATQEALALARPVAALHREVGAQQIVNYEILTSDGQVQRTTFRSGKAVTVNFGDTSWTDGESVIPGKTWSANTRA